MRKPLAEGGNGGGGRCRFAIERMLQESSEAEKIMDEQLTAALKERAQVTGSVRTHMQAQVDACRAELAAAQQRKAELQAAIDGKREPIALARQRYHMRKQRPVRELVHDEVEDALTQEFHDLQVIVNNLQMKMKQQNAEISQLHATLAHLEGNINDKANAGALDQQCLDIRRASAFLPLSAHEGCSETAHVRVHCPSHESWSR